MDGWQIREPGKKKQIVNGHVANQIKNHELKSDSTLHVVGVISNPVRYHSRYRIAREWIEVMAKTPNVKLHIVETAFGDRHHELEDLCRSLGVNFLPLRNKQHIWIKESMINLGVRDLLPRDWRYMAWIDADVSFENKDWAIETIHALQHHAVVQPWQHAIDMGAYGSILETHTSFASLVATKQLRKRKPSDPYKFGHPGFAWACTRAFWEATRGLIDCAILGSADHHMATGMVGDVSASVNEKCSPGFKKVCDEWSARALRATRGQIGFVSGFLKHSFHGPKRRRFYCERWQIPIQHGFDPEKHLSHDEQGLVRLAPEKHALDEDIRLYNLSRHEDSIEDT